MLTPQNYFQKVKDLDFESIDSVYKETHQALLDLTKGGETWAVYQNQDMREVIDDYFIKLEKNVLNKMDNKQPNSFNPSEKAQKTPQQNPVPKTPALVVEPKQKSPSPKHDKFPSEPHDSSQGEQDDEQDNVSHLPLEVKFIKRFLLLHGKVKSPQQVLSFLKSLQRSITEGFITKSSPYKKQMEYVQRSLIKLYSVMRSLTEIKLDEAILRKYKSILEDNTIFPSIRFIKRFVFLQGKQGIKKEAASLLNSLQRALDKGEINPSDKYYSTVQEIAHDLQTFVSNESMKKLELSPSQLNGLNNALASCGCSKQKHTVSLSGLVPHGVVPRMINSVDMLSLSFPKLGFTGKWKNFIGDPNAGFSMMIYGKPKFGKSFLALDLAGYLARFHGRVLYVAVEEGIDLTLQEKLREKNIAHRNLTVSSFLPHDLAPYDFVFLDSVNKLGLSPTDIELIRRKHPQKSIVEIFQTTKGGNFRGKQEHQHDVDVVVHVYEKGKASQYGRFNQGGELDIFSNE